MSMQICVKDFIPDWNSYIFNYKRGEVKSFLISSAKFWCDQFHIDALRVDAVSSMLRLDYSREEGQWEPNEFGGNGNIEAIEFIKDLNDHLIPRFPSNSNHCRRGIRLARHKSARVYGWIGFWHEMDDGLDA